MTIDIEHTPECGKITCKAFGAAERFQCPEQDILLLAKLKFYGEVAGKGRNNYVYNGDDSIKFPLPEPSKNEIACASKSTETKEATATPDIVEPQKQDRWILDKKNKQLTHVHITHRKALFTPSGAKECSIDPDRTCHSDK